MSIRSAAVIAGAIAAAHSPTPQQIRTAISHAEHSKDLWATVNICNTRHHPRTIGIRGQMPALGFRAQLRMVIQLDYWIKSQRRFAPDPGVHKTILLRSTAYGRYQTGVSYRFSQPAILRGTITFQWLRGHKLIGQARRHTTGHIKHVDYGDPPGYSAAVCVIPR